METEPSAGEVLFKAIFAFIAKVFIIMWAWNYVMPSFGLHEIGFLQSVAFSFLGECIFQPWTIAIRKS